MSRMAPTGQRLVALFLLLGLLVCAGFLYWQFGREPTYRTLAYGELIQALRQRLGVTSVIVTHELELCFGISDRVALLKGGRIAATGGSQAMRSSDHPDVRAFLAGVHDASGAEPPEAGSRPSVRGGPDGP